MHSGRLALHRVAVIALLSLAALLAHAEQAGTPSAPASPLVIQGLGSGTYALSGPWQFHPGDDPAWADPAFDTSAWEQLSADHPWGTQGHAHLTGFAWYRCSINIVPGPGVPQQFALLVPRIRDSYEIYWNGSLIGRNGKLPPHPVWYVSQRMPAFPLGHLERGVLAVRIWKAPLLSDDSGARGGFEAAPLIGSPEAIATARDAYEYQWLRSRQLHFGANLLSAVLALLGFLLWMRTPDRRVLLWTAGFAIAQPAQLLLTNSHMGWFYPVAMGVSQPLYAVQDISLWFLLLWLLPLHQNRGLWRLTRICAYIYLVGTTLDGVLVAIVWKQEWIGMIQLSDDLLTLSEVLLQALPLVLVGYALVQRRQFDSARWLVAIWPSSTK